MAFEADTTWVLLTSPPALLFFCSLSSGHVSFIASLKWVWHLLTSRSHTCCSLCLKLTSLNIGTSAPSRLLIFTQKLLSQQGLSWPPYLWLQPSSHMPCSPFPALLSSTVHISPPDRSHNLLTCFLYWLPLLAGPSPRLLNTHGTNSHSVTSHG